MSRTLTLFDRGWLTAKELAQAGRRDDAVALLGNLLARPGLPATVAAKARRLAGRLLLDAGRFAKARRQLLAAAKLEPGDADTHYRLGVAFETDPHGCDRRAARRFKRAAHLDTTNAKYWAAFARAAARCDRPGTARRAAETAAKLAPSFAPVLAVVAEALREAGQHALAVKLIGRAKFLAPADRAVDRLWDAVRFDAAGSAQKERRPKFLAAGPAVIPFDRSGAKPGAVVRRDVVSRPVPHVTRLRAFGARG